MRKFTLMLLAAMLSLPVWAQPHDLEIVALFTNTVVLKKGGQQKMLKVGQSYQGVTVISADSASATLEIDGQQHVVGVSRRVGASFTEPEQRVVTVRRNSNLQYLTQAKFNGRSAKVLVDTGANVILLNAQQARAMGIDYEKGQPSRVQTASSVVPSWMVQLESVELGGIKVNNVQAAVVEGDFPQTILLGMTFLKHVEISESDGVMSLSREW
jgi:aspartyl protease family protein